MPSDTALILTLPIPDKALSPNSRRNWRKKAQFTKLHRERARLRLLELLKGRPAPPISNYSLHFYHPTRARRDDDNSAASCKAYRDGIADALRIDDHRLPMSAAPIMDYDKQNPRLEIHLHPPTSHQQI